MRKICSKSSLWIGQEKKCSSRNKIIVDVIAIIFMKKTKYERTQKWTPAILVLELYSFLRKTVYININKTSFLWSEKER